VKLREKTFAALVAMIMTMALSVSMALRFFYISSIQAIERGEAEDAVRRLGLLVDEDLRQLDIMCRDWAYWDDTYRFASTGDDQFLTANIGHGETIDLLELSGLEIRDDSGATLYRFEQSDGLIDLVINQIVATGRMMLREGSSGLVIAPDGIHLVSVKSILRSNLGGPPRGIVVMARPLHQARITRYATIVGRSVEIRPAPAGGTAGARQDGGVTLETDDEVVRATVVVPGLSGRGAVSMTVTSPTVSARYGTIRFLTLIAVIVVIIAVTGALIIMMLEGTLLGRMRAIGRDLDRLATTEDRKTRLAASGTDELASLCTAMNSSLDRLDSMIDEREAMLHEIHHRVKNNLQVISSMLSLQASSARSAETVAAFGRSHNRLQAIAVVHDDALEHIRADHIDVLGLIRRIAASLASSLSGEFHPEVRFEGEAVEVGMDTALPIALIAGEVLHNAFIHAFRDRTAGAVTVRVRKTDSASILLELADDGAGIPAASQHRHGLGLSLVEALVLQLRGRHSVSRQPEGGTLVRLEAPLE
jgi:two-component sensor histidine kinase